MILVVDDEDLVREVVSDYLTRDGYRVLAAAAAQGARELLDRHRPDLAVLDIMLPGGDGLTLVRELRAAGSTLPIILLTARDDEVDRIMGLELGADDYVTKPFSPRELVARVRSVLRRTGGRGPVGAGTLGAGDLRIDVASREVHVGDRLVDLTPKEFDLLACLAAAPRRVFSHEALLQQVWDSSGRWQDPATVTVHVGRLRRKLRGARSHDARDRPAAPDGGEGTREGGPSITTVWGVGYRFDP